MNTEKVTDVAYFFSEINCNVLIIRKYILKFFAAPLNYFSEARLRDTKKPGTFTSSGPNENMICIYYEGILFLKAASSRIGKHSANA